MIAAALFITSRFGWSLTLTDAQTGQIYARYPVREGDTFSVGFVHSVNKSPLIDYYQIENGDIHVTDTLYYGFGAGVESDLLDGETLTYTEDGGMLVSNFPDNNREGLTYVVGTVSDHTLAIGGQEISLRELCGRNSLVTFTCDYGFQAR